MTHPNRDPGSGNNPIVIGISGFPCLLLSTRNGPSQIITKHHARKKRKTRVAALATLIDPQRYTAGIVDLRISA